MASGQVNLELKKDCPDDLKQLILACASYDPLQRPSFREIKNRLKVVAKQARFHFLQAPAAVQPKEQDRKRAESKSSQKRAESELLDVASETAADDMEITSKT